MSTPAAPSRVPLHLVVACDRRGVIGRDNALPWHLPEDLKHFKRLTIGHPVLMGRRTWESLGRPLPGRDNLVLSRTPGFAPHGARVVGSLDAARALTAGAPALMVIGGAELYRLCLPDAAVLHLTEVDAEVEGNVRFPDWDRSAWREVSRERHEVDDRHAYPFAFVRFERSEPRTDARQG